MIDTAPVAGEISVEASSGVGKAKLIAALANVPMLGFDGTGIGP